MKGKERLRNCFRLKDNEETWELKQTVNVGLALETGKRIAIKDLTGTVGEI